MARRRSIVVLLLTLASGCSVAVRSTDFHVSSNHVQHVPVPDSKKIIVRCRCLVRAAIESEAVEDIQLHVVGSYSSVGYHGRQKVPKAVPLALLDFKITTENGDTVAEGHEFRRIHHDFTLNSLDVYFPHGTTVVFDAVPDPGGTERVE